MGLRRSSIIVSSLLVLGASSLGACKKAPEGGEGAQAELSLRERADETFDPIVAVDVDDTKAALGERLYHDPNLSGDGTVPQRRRWGR